MVFDTFCQVKELPSASPGYSHGSKGVFAKQNIPVNSKICIEDPLLEVDGSTFSWEQIHAAFQKLTQVKKDSFLSLYYSKEKLAEILSGDLRHLGPDKELKAKLGAIYLQNSRRIENGNASAVYANASRFNHSCRENVTLTFEGKRLVIWPIGDIKAEEQLCCSYLPLRDLTLPTGERRGLLKRPWLFECLCDVCGGDWFASDKKRANIHLFAETGTKFNSNPTSKRAEWLVRNAPVALEAAEKEKLYLIIPQIHQLVAEAKKFLANRERIHLQSMAHSSEQQAKLVKCEQDLKGAQESVTLAIKAYKEYFGLDHPQTRHFKRETPAHLWISQ